MLPGGFCGLLSLLLYENLKPYRNIATTPLLQNLHRHFLVLSRLRLAENAYINRVMKLRRVLSQD